MKLHRFCILFTFITVSAIANAQVTGTLDTNSTFNLSPSYFTRVADGADRYYSAITGKTIKTLERLAKWEDRIKRLLDKLSPETSARLFSDFRLTFAGLLQQFRSGKAAADNYREQYNAYRDKVTTTIKYLDQHAEVLDSHSFKKLTIARIKNDKLNAQLKQADAVAAFIRERKKLLTDQCIRLLGKSRYLQKINKESFYYLETLRNYRELFSNPKKAEELALKILHKIKGFDEFLRRNGMLASLFRLPGDPTDPAYQASLAGLQTRSQVNSLIQQQLIAGGANARQQLQQNIQAAQAQLNELKAKVLRVGGGSSDAAIPEGFKPNLQKTRTFLQRLEYGVNIQSQRGNRFLPNNTDLALSVGYKLNAKSVVGLGAAYKLGLGRGLNAIRFTSEGIGFRSFIDWKIKGSFWLSGGFEMNYRSSFSGFEPLNKISAWQQSGLLGLTKSVPINTKFLKKTRVSVFWDMLSAQQVPRTQSLIFRIGYSF